MSKRMPLVSQHLENISREALEKFQDIVRRYVRRRQGEYALYRPNKLCYISLARHLRSRQHNELLSLLGKEKISEVKEGRLAIGRQPVLANYIDGPIDLQARYKGKIIKAQFRRNGSIRFKGKVYGSPSLEAAAACKRRSCYGWRFWNYERAPGDRIPVNELR